MHAFDSLPPRQKQVATLAVQGKPAKVIAFELGIKEHTVKSHLKLIYAKLGVKRKCELIKCVSDEIPPSSEGESNRDRILRLVVDGKATKQIAQELALSHNAAARHIGKLLKQYGVMTRTELAAKVCGLQVQAAE